MKLRVSVVMVVRNPHPRFFREAVESILAQTLDDLELIVVEDPSERSGEKILESCSDGRIRYFHQSQPTSLVEQRNRALEAAQGELVAICDADDIAVPDRLRKQVEFLDTHPETDVLGGQIAVIDHHGRHVGYRAFPVDHESILRAMPRMVPFCQPSVMIRSEALRAVGGYRDNGYLPEDYDLWSRLAKRGMGLANHREVLLHYRVHPEQMKACHLREIVRGVVRLKQTYWREEMDFGARLQMWAERLLVFLPPRWVYHLLLRVYYRGRACHASELDHLEQPRSRKRRTARAKHGFPVAG